MSSFLRGLIGPRASGQVGCKRAAGERANKGHIKPGSYSPKNTDAPNKCLKTDVLYSIIINQFQFFGPHFKSMITPAFGLLEVRQERVKLAFHPVHPGLQGDHPGCGGGAEAASPPPGIRQLHEESPRRLQKESFLRENFPTKQILCLYFSIF